ncbi:MAG: DUF2288 family protein [Bradymonadia bacterium]
MSTATELLNKLTAEINEGQWGLLADHFSKGRVLEVRGVELIAVGLSVALDRVAEVERWLASGQLVPVDAESAEAHSAELPIKLLIVQPFVLVQVTGQGLQ